MGLMLVIAVVRGTTEYRSVFMGQLLSVQAVFYLTVEAHQTSDQGRLDRH